MAGRLRIGVIVLRSGSRVGPARVLVQQDNLDALACAEDDRQVPALRRGAYHIADGDKKADRQGDKGERQRAPRLCPELACNLAHRGGC